MIRDLINILRLISDLIFLYHPFTLAIRYKYHIELNGVRSNPSEQSFEDWKKNNVNVNNYTLKSFIKSLLKNKFFRKGILIVLEFEKQRLLDDSLSDIRQSECQKVLELNDIN
jgi:hypothetical protein